MTTRPKPHSLTLSRRGFIAKAAASGAGLLIAGEADAASVHPSITYMKQVGKDLLAAHRNGTVASFLRAIQRHADVPDIALYSLGQYREKLNNGDRQRYFRGVAIFMSRYFADQSREYPVAKYELGDATPDGQDVLVASKVYLMSGQVYNVTWRLVWRNKGYKISDAKVLGFSLTYLQRGIFTSYLAKRNGDVKQLMAALEG
ncbi:MAG: ABC transporter substrate-binding protein [Parvibaculaceae bacterium]|jgi:ABC-type transporter MlaC component